MKFITKLQITRAVTPAWYIYKDMRCINIAYTLFKSFYRFCGWGGEKCINFAIEKDKY